VPFRRKATQKMYGGSEQELQNAIITYLRYRHYWVMRVNSGMAKTEGGGVIKMGVAGTPDILCIKYGLATWIEVKLPGKHSTPIQIARQAELRAAGCKVYEIHSLEEMQQVT
jgi:hypothetical protein